MLQRPAAHLPTRCKGPPICTFACVVACISAPHRPLSCHRCVKARPLSQRTIVRLSNQLSVGCGRTSRTVRPVSAPQGGETHRVVEYYGHSAYQVLAHDSSTRGVLRRTERQVDMAPTARALLVPRFQQTTHLRSIFAAPVARRRPLLLRADVLSLSDGGLSTIASPEGAPTDRMQERRPAAGVRTAGRPFQVTGGANSPITPRDDPPLKRFATETYPHQSKIQ